MSEKHMKEIAKELRLIRIEMQKTNKTYAYEEEDEPSLVQEFMEEMEHKAGERVTIK